MVFGYDTWPKPANKNTIPQLVSQRDVVKAWPKEPKGYTNLRGGSAIELRRDLVFNAKGLHSTPPMPDVKIDTCIYFNVVPCGTTMWEYFNSKGYLDRLNRLRKPFGPSPDGIFYDCTSDTSQRFCGHA